PSPLPTGLTEDPGWHGTPITPQTVPPGTWIPATPPPGAPALPPQVGVEPGAKVVKPTTIVRGQMPDPARTDSAPMLIQTMCRGKANGVEVRWTSSKKMTVCFEVLSEPEATRLVREISARPEFAPIAIDFCVVVK